MATVRKHVSKNGKVSYYFRAYNGYDMNGKQIQVRMTWSPKPNMSERSIQKELERQKVLFEERVKTGNIFNSNTYFKDYSEEWLENNKPPQLAPKTYDRYKNMLKNINAAIGGIKLCNLQSHHLIAFYNNLREEGVSRRGSYAIAKDLKEAIEKRGFTMNAFANKLGFANTTIGAACKEGHHVSVETAEKIAEALNMPVAKLFYIHDKTPGYSEKTILHHHRLISVILRQATMDRIIPFNVAAKDYMKAPKVTRKEAVYLEEDQLKEIIACLENESIKWKTIMYLLIYSGMRRGELFGLEWKDIDFDNNLIHIFRTSQYVRGMGIITKGTKNISSERTIGLPETAFKILKEYRLHWEEMRDILGDMWQDRIEVTYVDGKKEYIDNDRLFVKDDSTPMNPDSLTAWTKRFIRKYDLPQFTPHSLRHTNASLLIANGINIPTVSNRLGHANVTTTTKIYSHAIKSADAKAANVLEKKLNFLSDD